MLNRVHLFRDTTDCHLRHQQPACSCNICGIFLIVLRYWQCRGTQAKRVKVSDNLQTISTSGIKPGHAPNRPPLLQLHLLISCIAERDLRTASRQSVGHAEVVMIRVNIDASAGNDQRRFCLPWASRPQVRDLLSPPWSENSQFLSSAESPQCHSEIQSTKRRMRIKAQIERK